MNLKVYRLHSQLKQSEQVKAFNDAFLADINDLLFKEDLALSEKGNSDFISICFVESGGSEEKFVELFPKLASPIVIFYTGKNNSLPAAMEIKSYCDAHKKFALFVGNEPEEIAEGIKTFYSITSARHDMRGSRLGVVGNPSDWLIYSRADNGAIHKAFGVSLIEISMEEFQKEINKKLYPRFHRLEEIKKKWNLKPAVLKGALEIYGALKRLIIRYNLDGLTVRCFDLLGKYKNTACLALALLNEEGITAACEGDVPALLTMYLVNKIYGISSFMANPSYFFKDKKELLLAHCTVPFDMCEDYTFNTHFESGLGNAVQGKLYHGKVNIFKLSADLKELLSIEGKIVETPNLEGYCRTQISVQLDDENIMEFFSKSVGNHFIVCYADSDLPIAIAHQLMLFDLENN